MRRKKGWRDERDKIFVTLARFCLLGPHPCHPGAHWRQVTGKPRSLAGRCG